MSEQDWGGRGAHETANLAATPPADALLYTADEKKSEAGVDSDE